MTDKEVFDIVRKGYASIYRLCFVKDNVMYFTDDFKHQCGDDWNDSPYEYNAGEPYEWVDKWTEEENRKHGHAHIRYIAYMSWDIDEPRSYYCNSPYCVDDINKGKVAWLYHNEAGALMAGSTMEEAIEWLCKVRAKWGELK